MKGEGTPVVKQLSITVSDDGTGLEEDLQERMFAPFEKGAGSNGVGLGLCIVLESITRMSGKVSCSHLESGGTSFKIIVPVTPHTEALSSHGSEPVLLIVDDHPSIGDLLEKFAAESGWDAVVSQNRREALDRIATVSPDAVIVDLQLGSSEGGSLLSELVATHPNLFLIAMSAGPEEETKRIARKVGLTNVLAKPFTPGELRAVLSKVEGPKASRPGLPERLDSLKESGGQALASHDSDWFAKLAHETANEAFASGHARATGIFSDAEEAVRQGNWKMARDLWFRGWESLADDSPRTSRFKEEP